MKKIYQTPQMTATEIEIERVICGSDLREVDGQLKGSLYNTNATDAGLTKGRGKNVWDEQW
jgi:hypothetical protein